MLRLLVWQTQFTNQSKAFDMLRLFVVDREEDGKTIFSSTSETSVCIMSKLTCVHHSLVLLMTCVVAAIFLDQPSMR